jgi:hypothetical protein
MAAPPLPLNRARGYDDDCLLLRCISIIALSRYISKLLTVLLGCGAGSGQIICGDMLTRASPVTVTQIPSTWSGLSRSLNSTRPVASGMIG